MNNDVGLSHDCLSLGPSVGQLVNVVDWAVDPKGKTRSRGREEEPRIKKRSGRSGGDSVR